MRNVNKKLIYLNKALEISLGGGIFNKTSSLQRSVDITSYGRRVLNLFFPYLADELVEMSNNQRKLMMPSTDEIKKKLNSLENEAVLLGSSWGLSSIQGIEELENKPDVPLDILNKIHSIEDKYHALMENQLNENYWKNKFLKIYLEPKKTKSKVDVYFKGIENGARKKIINTQELSIFTNEEKKIFLKSAHIFNIHLRNSEGGDSPVSSGAITSESGYTVYNLSIFYSRYNPKFLKSNISKLYSDILELIVHESTHQQQFLLRDRVSDLLYDYPELGLISEEEGSDYSPLTIDRGSINYKNKDIVKRWIESKFKFEEEEPWDDEEYRTPDLSGNLESKAPEESTESEKEKLINMILRNCPDTLLLAKEEARNSNQNIEDIFFKYRDACSEERRINITEQISESYHKNREKSTDFEVKKYYTDPVEIEAYIRGFRSILKGSGKPFATEFCKNIAANFSNINTSKEVWELYKEMYRRLNYPEKDLGDDTTALACVKRIQKK